METVGLWSHSGHLGGPLRRRLGQAYPFVEGNHPACFAGVALLVVAPDATGLAGLTVLDPPLALLPGGSAAACRQVRAASAVSYGLGGRNTLTFSSLAADRVSVALQRELLTLSGRRVEPQEWVLPVDALPAAPEGLLCLVGALLLLDQDPTLP